MGGNRLRAAWATAVLGVLTAGVPALWAPPAGAAELDPRCLHGRVVCIDKTTHRLRWMIDGQVQLSMSARFGGSHGPTREGEFTIYWKDPDHISHLTGEAMPYSMFFSGGEAIHYSPDFAENGYDGASSGCVDTRDYDSTQELYQATEEGDRVVVYRS